MAATYLPPFMVAMLFVMVIGSLSSTADSDLSALSAIVMTDVYGKHIAKNKPDPHKMLWVGRFTMVVAALLGVVFASLKLDILSMLIFVGALWGSIVFPVIASLYWNRVTNAAFTVSVAVSFLLFLIVRFSWLPIEGAVAVFFEIFAAVGGGVVIGLMTFGFFGRMAGLVMGMIAALVLVFFTVGFLREYTVLLSSLTAYGASTIICTLMTLRSKAPDFDFDSIDKSVIAFHKEAQA